MIERHHPIRSAITMAGIVGCSRNNARIGGPKASTIDPDAAHLWGGGTVDTHVSRILHKTDSRDRAQAIVVAFTSGLVGACRLDTGPRAE